MIPENRDRLAATPPGSTIGFLGGGQLGRMAGMAARSMGYDVHVLDPDSDCPASAIASKVVTARFDDADAAAELASGCDVVTLEIEQIGKESLQAVHEVCPLRPGVEAVYIIQDRLRQREWLNGNSFPTGPFVSAITAEDLEKAVSAMGPSIAKSCHGGYDGRGQARIDNKSDFKEAFSLLSSSRIIVEKFIDIETEISVLVARTPSGQIEAYPASRNFHNHGILTWSVVPAVISNEIQIAAKQLACSIAETLGIEGLLGVEMFITSDGKLLVNELAPRTHNTFHHSVRASSTGQFEQLIRAICNLPLGSTRTVSPGAIVNLLGDIWLRDDEPDFNASLSIPESRIHLYGKKSARLGRKMGHISTLGSTSHEALQKAVESFRALSPQSVADAGLDQPIPSLDRSNPI